jgi:hypothetical protein
MILSKANAKTNVTFIVQVSLMIVTYDCQNMFIEEATGPSCVNFSIQLYWMDTSISVTFLLVVIW